MKFEWYLDPSALERFSGEPDSDGWTSLTAASFMGRTDLVESMIKKHFCVHQTLGYAKETPLSLAAAQGHLDTVRLLLDAGSSPFINTRVQSEAVLGILNEEIQKIVYSLPFPDDILGCVAEYLYIPAAVFPSEVAGRGAIMQLVAKGLYDVVDVINLSNKGRTRQTNGRIQGVPTKSKFQQEEKIAVFSPEQLRYDPGFCNQTERCCNIT